MVQGVQQKRIPPEVRAQNFALMTRQNVQALPAFTVAENMSYSFQIPKVRLVSKIRLYFQGIITATHAVNPTFTPHPHAPYNLINNIRVELNNGFMPYNISGRDAYFYNLIQNQGVVITALTPPLAATALASRARTVMGVQSAAGGQANVVRFCLDLPVALNDRDPVGLIVAQNDETYMTVTVDLADCDVVTSALAGYTLALSGATITPVVESFSIPALGEALPDISILKLVQRKTQTISAGGTVTLELPTGLTYRKLLIYIEDATGGEFDTDITGDFELLLNQADIPYRVRPYILNSINQEQYGQALPQGLWVYDFSYQGLANLGGARDYIDTEKLTEFWFRFQAAGAGNITAIYETLSKLRGV